MLGKYNLYLPVLLVVSALFLTSCGNSSSDSASSATISGVVRGESSQTNNKAKTSGSSGGTSVEGATVTAAEVTSSGSLQTINGTQATTNTSGQFTLAVDVESAQRIVIVAEKEGQRWMGFLSEGIKNGNNVTIKPLDVESTVEADVFARVVSSGNPNAVAKPDIEIAITDTVASEIRANATAISQISSGISSAGRARGSAIAEFAVENAEQVENRALELLIEAQLRLEAELSSATTVEQKKAAISLFQETFVNAHTQAGLEIAAAAKVIEMQSRSLRNSATGISEKAQNSMRVSVETVKAIAVDASVRAEAEAAQLSESSRQAIAEAGFQLRSEIESSSGAASEIQAIFEAYHDSVREAIENDSSTDAVVIAEIDAEINASLGPRSELNSSIAGSISTELMIQAYKAYFDAVSLIVSSKMNSAGSSSIEAFSELFILINLRL